MLSVFTGAFIQKCPEKSQKRKQPLAHLVTVADVFKAKQEQPPHTEKLKNKCFPLQASDM